MKSRERRMWWAVVDGEVEEVECLSCYDSPNMWYCPTFEYTLCVGRHLFETEKEALIKAIGDIEKSLESLQAKLFESKSRYGKAN